MSNFVYLVISLFFLVVSVGSVMKNRSGNMNFLSPRILMAAGFYGAYVWFTNRQSFFLEVTTGLGVLLYLTWFVAVIMARDRIYHFICLIAGMIILVWADGFKYYKFLIAVFSIILVTARYCFWWYFEGRDSAISGINTAVSFGKRIESSYLTDFFSKHWMPKK